MIRQEEHPIVKANSVGPPNLFDKHCAITHLEFIYSLN